MKLGTLTSFVATALLLLAIVAYGGEVRVSVEFSIEDLVSSKVGGYDLVRLRNDHLTSKVGEPMVPAVSMFVVVPPTADAISLEGVSLEATAIPGNYLLHPAQKPRPVSSEAPAAPFAEPDEAIYASSNPYPGKLAEFRHTGSMGGYRVVSFVVYPLQYLPSQRALTLHKTVEVRIEYQQRGSVGPPKTERQRAVVGERLRKLVQNPQDVDRWAPPVASLDRQNTTEYVIVTTDPYVSYLQTLVDWKLRKGVLAEIKKVAWINANYGGHYDTQENIREFLKDYYTNHGLIWVLLAGDISVVPHRIVKAEVPDERLEGWIPCDLYFSDLDGTCGRRGQVLT